MNCISRLATPRPCSCQGTPPWPRPAHHRHRCQPCRPAGHLTCPADENGGGVSIICSAGSAADKVLGLSSPSTCPPLDLGRGARHGAARHTATREEREAHHRKLRLALPGTCLLAGTSERVQPIALACHISQFDYLLSIAVRSYNMFKTFCFLRQGQWEVRSLIPSTRVVVWFKSLSILLRLVIVKFETGRGKLFRSTYAIC